MSALTIEDLRAIRLALTDATNQARREAEAFAGADVLLASGAAVPKFSQRTRNAVKRTDELRALHGRVGVVLDDMLVASDPTGAFTPAAHARVRERNAGKLAIEKMGPMGPMS